MVCETCRQTNNYVFLLMDFFMSAAKAQVVKKEKLL